MSESPRGLQEFEEDSKWFYENINHLREKNLSGKFVAIKNKKVLASDKEISLVIKMVESQGENPAYVIIEFIYPEGTIVLL
ncbi:hypothetical protein J4416_00775 [Candidatus Pacearchaeota archaeon]|nr:hypothetical protein [Candidatus Pacearchaeota archaeon]